MHHIDADIILLDIEGTLGSIDFVARVLFPFSRQRLEQFVLEHDGDPAVQSILEDTRAAAPNQPTLDTLRDWHDRDVKAGPLKQLQGLIWAEGYRDGAFTSHLYDDAFEAIAKWRAAGKRLCVYSSGSRQAQLLYFEYSAFGDLRPLFTDYFDTTVGLKTEAASYRAIAKALGAKPSRILFLTDNPREARAAIEASFIAIQIARDGMVADPALPNASDFDSIDVTGA